MENNTGTLYTFIMQTSEVVVANTTDIRALKRILQGSWFALLESVLINGKTYIISNVV